MTLTLNELNSVTQVYWDNTSTDIWHTESPILYKIANAGSSADGGTKIQKIVEYGGQNSGTFGNNTSLPLEKVEILNSAYFPWAAYYSNTVIDFKDQQQNNGASAIVDIVQARLNNMMKTLHETMAAHLYSTYTLNTGTGAPGFVGLGDMFNTTTSTAYGEIAEDDMSDWKANVITTSLVFTYEVLQQMQRTAKLNSNAEGKPNLYVTTDTLFDSFERTLQNQVRYEDADMANAGFTALKFRGVPIVVDYYCPSGYCYGLNLRYIDLVHHSKFNYTKPVWAASITQPLNKVAYTLWSGQLTTNNRKAHILANALTAAE